MRKPKFSPSEIEMLKEVWEAGKVSYSKGQSSVPAQNPDYMEMIRKNPLPIGSLSIARCATFANGWIAAMLDEPIPGMEDFFNSRPKSKFYLP